jgi:hypothetical protein
MKKSEIQVGMNVVVNDTPDATVYEIDYIEGFEAHLIYNTRMGAVSAGWIDVSRIHKEVKQAEHN